MSEEVQKAPRPDPWSAEELANERERLISAGDASEMETHMARNGAHDDLVAAVATVLLDQNPGTPTY